MIFNSSPLDLIRDMFELAGMFPVKGGELIDLKYTKEDPTWGLC